MNDQPALFMSVSNVRSQNKLAELREFSSTPRTSKAVVLMAESNSQERLPPRSCSCRERPSTIPIDETIWKHAIENYSNPNGHVPIPARNATAADKHNVPSNTADATAAGRDDNNPRSIGHGEEKADIDSHVGGTPGFITLVNNGHWLEPRWLHRLRHGRKGHDETCKYGFWLDLADIQRMNMRLLQARVTCLAFSAEFDNDHGVSKGVLSELGPALQDYGAFRRPPSYFLLKACFDYQMEVTIFSY